MSLKSKVALGGIVVALAVAGATFFPASRVRPPHVRPHGASVRAVAVPGDEISRGATEVVAHSPQEALAWVRAQGDPERRQQCLLAVMRAWGKKDVLAAVAWALGQNESWSALAAETALTAGAAARPGLALRVARELIAADPAVGAPLASALIRTLASEDRFDLAVRLANDAFPSLGPDLTVDAFSSWGHRNPAEALQAVGGISDEQQHRLALQAVVEAWAKRDPAGLASEAWTAFSGEDRSYALRQAMDNWAEQDFAGMTRWLATLPAGADLDSGAALAAKFAATRDPDAALNWLTMISDPAVRSRSLQHLLAEIDPRTAQAMLARVAWLSPEEFGTMRPSVTLPP